MILDKEILLWAKLLACRSKDPSTKVGAVIYDPVKEKIISTGINYIPDNLKQTFEVKEEKYKRIIHAEMSALLASEQDLTGCFLYTTYLPCCDCCKHIIASGIKRVIFSYNQIPERWVKSMNESLNLFIEAGVELVEVA